MGDGRWGNAQEALLTHNLCGPLFQGWGGASGEGQGDLLQHVEVTMAFLLCNSTLA